MATTFQGLGPARPLKSFQQHERDAEDAKNKAQAQPVSARPRVAVAQSPAQAAPASPMPSYGGSDQPQRSNFAAWKQAPKVDPKTLVNPTGAVMPGILDPSKQAGATKINRLTGKPFGWRPGDADATPYAMAVAKGDSAAALARPGAPKPAAPAAPTPAAPKSQSKLAGMLAQTRAASAIGKPASPMAQSWKTMPSPVPTPQRTAGIAATAGFGERPAQTPARATAKPTTAAPGFNATAPVPAGGVQSVGATAPKAPKPQGKPTDLASRLGDDFSTSPGMDAIRKGASYVGGPKVKPPAPGPPVFSGRPLSMTTPEDATARRDASEAEQKKAASESAHAKFATDQSKLQADYAAKQKRREWKRSSREADIDAGKTIPEWQRNTLFGTARQWSQRKWNNYAAPRDIGT